MDAKLFTNPATGVVVPTGRRAPEEFAFVPAELPPRTVAPSDFVRPDLWEMPAELWPLLAEAKESLGTLNGIAQALPDPSLLLRPLENREAVSSSRIEGTYVRPEELLAGQFDPEARPTAQDALADWVEVFNYGQALRVGYDLLQEVPFCNRLLREMHQTLMQGTFGQDPRPGEFRTVQNRIGASGRYVPPPWEEIERLMANLESYMNTDRSHDSLIRCCIAHYQFEAIHPFRDGNGRVGRLLLSLMIYRLHGHANPVLFMSDYFDRYKDDYIDCMFRVSTLGDWEGWLTFCLRGVRLLADESVRRCRALLELRREYLKAVQRPRTDTARLIELLFSSPLVTAHQVSVGLGIAYNTAKANIDLLVEHEILAVYRDGRPQVFHAPRVIEIAYSEPQF